MLWRSSLDWAIIIGFQILSFIKYLMSFFTVKIIYMSKRIKQIFFKNHSFPWAIFQYFYYDLLCNSENPLWLIHLLNISEKQRFSIFRNAAYYFKSDQFSFTNSFTGNHRVIMFQGFNYVKDFLHIIKRPSKIAHKTAFLQHSSMLLDT